MRELLLVHEEEHAAVTVLTAVLADASGYGRVVRGNQESGCFASSRIVMPMRGQAIREINVGTYVVDGDFYSPLGKTRPTQCPRGILFDGYCSSGIRAGSTVAAVRLDNPEEGLGVNTRDNWPRLNRLFATAFGIAGWMQG